MASSDSDDEFASLITNGESVFWKNYQFNPEHHEAQSSGTKSFINKLEESNRQQTCLANTAKASTSVKKKKHSLTSTDTSIEDEKCTSRKHSPSQTKDIDHYSTSNTTASESQSSLVKAVLKTLSSKPLQLETKENLDCFLDDDCLMQMAESPPAAFMHGRRSKRTARRSRRQSQLAKRQCTRAETANQILAAAAAFVNINPFPTIAITGGISSPPTKDSTDASEVIRCPTPPYKKLSYEEFNPLIDMKVLWKSVHQKIFQVKRFTPLKAIVDYFANSENVDPTHICFSINDKMVDLNVHSCVTLKYRPYDEIEGGILKCNNSQLNFCGRHKQGMKLKVRHNKHVEIIILEADIRGEHLYAHVVIKFGLTFGQFKLDFDGSTIDCSESLRSAGLEDGDCIDILL